MAQATERRDEVIIKTGEGTTDLRVRITPKSSRDKVAGLVETPDGMALCVRVRAVPDGGKANAALCVVLANWLGVAKTRVALMSGATSRVKTIRADADEADVRAALERVDLISNGT